MKITPSLLFNYLQCSHKPWRDIYGPVEEKSKEVNPFLQLLWENGVSHEKEIISNFTEDFIDLSEGSFDDRIQRTKEAMNAKVKSIYQGVIQFDEMFGIPDLLSFEENCGYVPIDIKSGKGLEGSDEENGIVGKQKPHYGIQLCAYNEILLNLGYSIGMKGYILDGDKNLVEYNFNAPLGVRNQQTLWDFYLETKEKVKELLSNQTQNLPALSGTCKLCQWQESCKKWAKDKGDLTLIFNLGRKFRDVLTIETDIQTVKGLAKADLNPLLERKESEKGFLKGIGPKTLITAKKRAEILYLNSPPVLYRPIFLPKVSVEIYWDIEDDSTQDGGFVYLHGCFIRTKGSSEFKYFIAEDVNKESEKKAWGEFWTFVRTLPENDFAFYYYSQHEKTTYRKLQKKYPEVITEGELENFFSNINVIDLYSLVTQNTDWPLSSYSIKAIATFLGFKWRDVSPSGAASIEWYNRYLETGDKTILNRILEYNEDDCVATVFLKDKLIEMDSHLSTNSL